MDNRWLLNIAAEMVTKALFIREVPSLKLGKYWNRTSDYSPTTSFQNFFLIHYFLVIQSHGAWDTDMSLNKPHINKQIPGSWSKKFYWTPLSRISISHCEKHCLFLNTKSINLHYEFLPLNHIVSQLSSHLHSLCPRNFNITCDLFTNTPKIIFQ